jgi:hypothetical protein
MFAFDNVIQSYNHLAVWSKEMEDRSKGWSFEDTGRLRLAWDGQTTRLLPVEIHREPILGFSLRRDRTDVRFRRLPVDEIIKTDPLSNPPLCRISLYDENDRLFGEAQAWQWKTMYQLNNGGFDFFLCDYYVPVKID